MGGIAEVSAIAVARSMAIVVVALIVLGFEFVWVLTRLPSPREARPVFVAPSR